MPMQRCDLEADCRARLRRGDFDKDNDCSWCVIGIMEHCDRREPSGICNHPRLYLTWGDDFPGDRDEPGSLHTTCCSKCSEEAENA